MAPTNRHTARICMEKMVRRMAQRAILKGMNTIQVSVTVTRWVTSEVEEKPNVKLSNRMLFQN